MPSAVASLVKVTRPVAVPAGELTVAVRVTAWPSIEGLVVEVSAVAVAAGAAAKAKAPRGVPSPVGPS